MGALMQLPVKLQSAADHSKLLILTPKCEETCPLLVNLKLSLYVPLRHIGKLEIQLPQFFTSALDGSEWPTSHPGCFTSEERDFGNHRIGSWVDPRTDLDILKKR